MRKNQNILVIGGSGSWGQELTKQILANHNPKQITIFSRGEHKQVEMQRKFNSPKLRFVIGDIRDYSMLEQAMEGKDLVFHLAALKHVPVCEKNPEETFKTNIQGTANAVDCAISQKVKQFVLVSTDKAVDPINTYGVSKSMAEKIVIGGNYKPSKTKFTCIRAGNVLGSNGSVVPLFKNQILQTNTVTLTSKDMTRYIMTLESAISLIFKAVELSKGGEIFVTKMPSFKITDLIDVMIEEIGNKDTKVKIIGVRPGEKYHECLVSRYEASRAIEYGNYYVTLPTINYSELKKKWPGKNLTKEYNSKENIFLSKKQIKQMLQKEGFLSQRPEKELEHLSKQELIHYFTREQWKK